MGEAEQRIKKLNNIKEKGINPYPAESQRSHTCLEVDQNFTDLEKKKVILAGRLVLIRVHGKALFGNLEDESGRFQIFLRKDDLKNDRYDFFIKNIDAGDFIQAEGELFKTKKGEKTLRVFSWKILSKAILPLPEKWHGLADIETRFRNRHLDLLSNKEIKDIFLKRSQVIRTIRDFFNKNDFIELETPILQSMPGGANARPFVTHHHSLDIDLYLRIAPELYLKRLIVGGFEKVYEVARCFRNEGIDWSHNPEFTQVEFYQAYADYQDMMNFMEKLFKEIVQKVNNKLTLKYQGKEINFKPPYPKLDYRQALIDYTGIDLDKEDLKSLSKKAKKLKIKVDKSWGKGKIIDEIYKEHVRPKIVNPTFLINHPIELSPLSKQIPERPNYVERFQLLVAGFEVCNAFSELNDPFEQEKRFKEQKKLLEKGDQEAQPFDQDFLKALKHGMPPTAGAGLGIDRLLTILADKKNIKEVILFPTLKPKEEE